MPRVGRGDRKSRPEAHGGPGAGPRWTVVFFHAHPDDEALLTGGTMARLAAEGHRVVLVTATAGELGMVSTDLLGSTSLADVRLDELRASADALGCARMIVLGYPDSGSEPRSSEPGQTEPGQTEPGQTEPGQTEPGQTEPGQTEPGQTEPGQSDPRTDRRSGPFAEMDVDVAAETLAEILREEAADVLTIYDPAGGYGHPDHLQVHRVGVRAARLAGTGVVLEATVDRRLLRRALSIARPFVPRTADFAPARFDALFTAPESITHRIDVSAVLDQKRAAMRAHHTQTTTDTGIERGLAWMLRLPRPLYRLAFGREWFVEHGRRPTEHPLDDLLATLRPPR